MTHDELIDDLAAHLKGQGRLVWRDMQMGPSGSARPDVWSIQPSYMRPDPMCYEVKATRSDYLSDVTTGKWQSYLPFSSGVIFAAEKGLISRTEIPATCGLIERGAGWRIARRPILNPVVLPQETCLKLLIDGVKREGPEIRARIWSEHGVRDKIGKKFGLVIAKYLEDRSVAEYELEHARKEAHRIDTQARKAAERILAEAHENLDPMRAELCEILGMPNAQAYQLRARIEEIRAGNKSELHHVLRSLRGLLDRYEPARVEGETS